jgi:hypothetical protein
MAAVLVVQGFQLLLFSLESMPRQARAQLCKQDNIP